MQLARDKSQDAALRQAWENSTLSATEIGRQYGVSKHVVIGLAQRQRWTPRGEPMGPPASTMLDRLDALNARMDAVVAATETVLEVDRQRQRNLAAEQRAAKRR